ncbi:TPA: hypothetical protein ACGR33_003505 [Escherichia coli]
MNEMTAAQELEKAREVTNCPQGVELQEHLKQLVAENVAFKSYRPQPGGVAMMDALDAIEAQDDYPEGGMMDAFEILCAKRMPSPVTDSILREAEARGVDKAIEHLLTKFSCTGHVGVPAMALEYLAKQLREGKA